MRLLVPGLVLSGLLACPAATFASDWVIDYPFDNHLFYETSDISTSGTAPLGVDEVLVSIEKKLTAGNWVEIDHVELEPEMAGAWGTHNFGAQSKGVYRIALYEIGNSTPKDTVQFSVLAEPM